MKYLLLICSLLILMSCNDACTQKVDRKKEISQSNEGSMILNQKGNTIKSRFAPPTQFKRQPQEPKSFASYLQNLPLKSSDAQVEYYNGSKKSTSTIYEAVIDLPIGNKDLHQCADAVMRLKAEYHWINREYDLIHFNFTNGFRVDYTEWMRGRRMIVKGNRTYWNDMDAPSNTYKDFWSFMELIFMYAGTASLSKELMPINISDMQIGDILIKGGHPGHAVIIVDMAVSQETGQQVFMLAQSYMPAQELQILQNRNNPDLSPWYPLDNSAQISTPEWSFSSSELKRFQE